MPWLTIRGAVSTRTALPSESVPLRMIPSPLLLASLITFLSASVTLTVPAEVAETQAVPSALTS